MHAASDITSTQIITLPYSHSMVAGGLPEMS